MHTFSFTKFPTHLQVSPEQLTQDKLQAKSNVQH